MGFDSECVLGIESVPHVYFCIYCRALIYPNEALQAPCKHLLCTSCLTGANSCPHDSFLLTENNCKPLLESNKPLAEMIGEVMVCCRNHKSSCKWQGMLSDYVTHGTNCTFANSHTIGSSTQTTPIQVQGPGYNNNQDGDPIGQGSLALESSLLEPEKSKNAMDATEQDGEPIGQGSLALESSLLEPEKSKNAIDATEEMARKYANAYFLWTWHETVVEGHTVLSQAKDHDEGMSLFYSTISALEANLRVKGYNVKELSPYELFEQYTHMNKESSFNGFSELLKAAHILKNTGAVELNPDEITTARHTILDYKIFDTKTPEGLSDALDHLRMHGPLVGVYYVTEYQKRNSDSFGILHSAEDEALNICEKTDDRIAEISSKTTVCSTRSLKNTICITGFGVEDSCSFLQFQKFRSGQDDKGMFGRVLHSSIIELIGFYVEESPARCSKRPKRET